MVLGLEGACGVAASLNVALVGQLQQLGHFRVPAGVGLGLHRLALSVDPDPDGGLRWRSSRSRAPAGLSSWAAHFMNGVEVRAWRHCR
jgi:hypothetical protein